jgi:putative endonuclease
LFVYVLKSLKDGKRYVGISANLQNRIIQHNRGEVKATRGRRPFEIVYHEELGSLLDARGREKYLKSAAGRRFLKKIGL